MIPNGRVLTVIACGPKQELVLRDGNTFLADAFKLLKPIAEKDEQSFRLATAQNLWSVRSEIAAFAAGSPRPTLQIIGHGRPGELELGRSWPEPGKPVSSSSMVENNSKLLALLPPSTGERLAEVRLVACKVGDEDGYPLLFSLAHLFACDVVGSNGDIDADMFDKETGLYEGATTRYARSLRDFRKKPAPLQLLANKAEARSLPHPRQVPQLVFETLHFSRKLSLISDHPVCMSLADREASKLKELCKPISAVPDGPCVVELAFGVRATLPGQQRPCSAVLEIMSNRRCRLVLPTSEKPHAFRWEASDLWSSAVAKAVIARYEQAWRDGFMGQA